MVHKGWMWMELTGVQKAGVFHSREQSRSCPVRFWEAQSREREDGLDLGRLLWGGFRGKGSQDERRETSGGLRFWMSAKAMADVSERTLQVSVLVAFASGVVLGWQANRLRRRYLDWRKRRLQDKLATTQKKLDLAWARAAARVRRVLTP